MGIALAQGTFTIVRPLDGSTVRETVKVRVPKNSIPENGYLGVVVNGKFLEAVMPDVEGDNYVYDLDSKARGLQDGPLNIEMILYQDMGEGRKPQVLNRSSVRVNLDNHTSIAVGEQGRKLRYKFNPGSQWIYRIKESVSMGQVTQAQAQLGSHAYETVLKDEEQRLLYAIDNAYSGDDGKEGLVRMQPLPDKGKDFTFATLTGQTEPTLVYDYQMQPLYMRITDTGREIFGSWPSYFPMDGTAGDSSVTDVASVLPLPVLPTGAKKPGDIWQGTFMLPAVNPGDKDNIQKLAQALPGKATFEGVEWQHGIPCAKIRTQVAVGPKDLKDVTNLGLSEGQASSVSLESLVWLALDRGVLVRQEMILTQESIVDVPVNTGVSGGTGFGGTGFPGGGPPGAPGRGGIGGKGAGGGADVSDLNRPGLPSFDLDPRVDDNGNVSLFQQRPGRPGGGRPGAPPGAFGPPPGTGLPGKGGATGGGATGQAMQKQIVRLSATIVMELED